MVERLIHLTTRRAWPVLVVSLLVVVLAALVGGGAIGKLKGGGFDDPASESSRARAALADTVHLPVGNLLLLVTAPDGADVDDARVVAAGRDVVRRLADTPGVTLIGDYWSAPKAAAPGLRSTDGAKALVVAHVDGDEDAVRERSAELRPLFGGTTPDGVLISVGGWGPANAEVTGQVTSDLARAESIAIPLTLALLVVVFGSAVAGMLPLLVGGIAIAATFAALSGIAEVTDVSIFALNLTTALGLGLGIDYALLVVSRFREELERGRSVDDAIAVTLRTAGRTVVFSAATIAVALSALLVFPLFFLRSFAYAGMVVVAVTALASVVTMPALLAVLGPRVNRFRVGRRRSALPSSDGFWSRLARVVMRRPVLTALPVLAVLAGMALPFAGVQFGVPDDRVVPASSSEARRVGDVLRTDFASRDSDALSVVLPRVEGGRQTVASYVLRLSRLDGVARVDAPTGTYVDGRQVAPGREDLAAGTAAAVRVLTTLEPHSDAAQDLVREVRAVPAPGGRMVGGPSAELVDTLASIADRLPLAAGLIALTTFVLLFLFTGSVVLPLKALALNAATIVAVVGAMVWVFQDGHLAGQLGFTPLPLTVTMPLLMFCVAFGLSMDYEVFLLGRIKEQHDAGADTATAVAVGLERTGRIVTTAAALLAITFFAFVTSKVSFIQMFGLGTGLAVVLDATLVRGVLVPSLMRLMGSVNWWAPGPLRRLHARIGLSENDGGPQPVSAGLVTTGR